MSDDDSEPQEESTKQVDREMLNRALNDSVDSREVMKRVNAQLGEDLHDGGTARVDRDAVAQYLEAARSGEFPTVPATTPAPKAGPAAGQVPGTPPPMPGGPPSSRGPREKVADLPNIEAAMVEPIVETPAPAAPKPATPAQRRSWSSGTAEVEPEPIAAPEPRILTWILVLAAAGILLGIAMAVAWMALAG